MKPIGQTFFINEPAPPSGTPGVLLTAIDIYFQSISSTYGIELQIRPTENGYPTSTRLPFGQCILTPFTKKQDNTNALVASATAALPSKFEFNTPVYLETGKVYAFVLIPVGGNPDYNVWSGEIGKTDVTSAAAITTNNDTGDLFLSSNDIAWQPVITEDIKFTLYTANFTSSSGYAIFNSPDEEYISFRSNTGIFSSRDKVVFSNTYNNIALLNISSKNGTFSLNDVVYQSNGTANTATGKVYSSNSTVIKVNSVTGTFNTSNTLYDFNSATANAVLSSVYQNVVTTSSSNTVTVPDSTIYALYDYIFSQKKDMSDTQVVWISEKPSNTTIKTSNPIRFTEDDAKYGSITSNAMLSAGFSASVSNKDYNYAVLDNTTANSTINLGNLKNIQIIDLVTGVSANMVSTLNPVYNSITTNFNSLTLPNTALDWSFRGFINDGSYTQESNYTTIVNREINELIDTERVFMSRSNEYASLPAGRKGDSSFLLRVDYASQNIKISPMIDTMETNVTFTKNIVDKDIYLSGAYITGNVSSGTVVVSDILYQNTSTFTGFTNSVSTATVYNVPNTSYFDVYGVNGRLINYAAYTTSGGAAGTIENASRYRESSVLGNYFNTSRYISKTVVLEEAQDAEDIRAYLSAYRPANTNFRVYAAVQNSHDSERFNQKSWSRLYEISPDSLRSSITDPDDQVELVYGFNSSKRLFSVNTVVNRNGNSITFNANTQVDGTNEFITLSGGNPFSNNDIVLYTVAAGNTAVTGLTTATSYYVVSSNSTGVKLSSSLNGDVINLTPSTVSETGHTLSCVSSLVVSCQSTVGITNNSFVYLKSSTDASFNVREVIHVLNATSFVVDRYPSFVDSNATIGQIPGIESTTSAFLYDLNNYIVRYCTFDDSVYDSYIQFATKIVMTSDASYIAPRAGDLRVLALQI